jgi:hypothetical protein
VLAYSDAASFACESCEFRGTQTFPKGFAFGVGVLLFLGLSSRERLSTHHYLLLLLLLLLLLAGFLFWLTFVVHGFELFSFLFRVLMHRGVFFFPPFLVFSFLTPLQQH